MARHTAEPVYRAAGVLLVRAAAGPGRPSDPERSVSPAGRPDDITWWLDRLGPLVADPVLMEAVTVASPSVAAAARAAAAGRPPTRLPDARRLVLALTGYAVRMATRTTPFGLFAGVVAGRFGAGPGARLDGWRTDTRPDAQWLANLAGRLDTDPLVLARLQLTASELCTVERGRIDANGVSVTVTPAITAVLRLTATPIAHPDLIAALTADAPERAAATALVADLVRHRVLLTDLLPAPECADPLGHLLDRLDGHPIATDLHAIRDGHYAYDGLPAGAGQAVFESVRDRMRALAPTDHPMHVDLAAGAEIRLPSVVAREVERAADTLWQLTPDYVGSPRLRAYHQMFLERYGTDRAVPLAELLSPERGLGLPAPAPAGGAPSPDRAAERVRDELLARLLADAAADRGEVHLDDDLLAKLARPKRAGTVPPASMEFYAQLVATSFDAVDHGAFQVVCGPYVGSARAGAMIGRFAALLPGIAGDLAAAVAPQDGDGPLHAAVTYRPRSPRTANVMRAPRWHDHRIPVGVGATADGRYDLRLSDLAVAAGMDRLTLYSQRLGRAVVPASFNVVNHGTEAPPVVVFLTELAREGTCAVHAWNWGPAGAAPYLPRVRRGRTVLAAATWRLDASLRGTSTADAIGWTSRLLAWRKAVGLPRRVLVAEYGQHLVLDLDDPVQLQLLRRACRRDDDVIVREALDDTDGWLAGPDGTYRGEIVVPLRRASDPAPSSRPMPPVRRVDRASLPGGGSWLSAKLYAGPAAQGELLHGHLEDLVDRIGDAADGWFFLRYADPRPHLRVRVRGDRPDLWSRALPALSGWAAARRAAGLIGDLVLDTYDPEVERYGGPAAIDAAERAFQADSVAVLTLLRALPAVTVDPVVVGALSVLDLVDALDASGGAADAISARRDARPAGSARRDAVRLADPGGAWATLAAEPGGGRLIHAWHGRRSAVEAYGDALRRAAAPVATVARSVIHLHCNRLFGTDRDIERVVMALVADTIRSRAARARSGH